MLQVGQHATGRSICARCALRSRLAVFRTKRLKHSSSSGDIDRLEAADTNAVRARYYLSSSSDLHSFSTKTRPPPHGRQHDRDIIRKIVLGSTPAGSRRSGDGNGGYPDRGQHDNRDFPEILRSRLQLIRDEVKNAPLLTQVAKEARENGEGNGRGGGFKKLWKEFVQGIQQSESGIVNVTLASDADRKNSGRLMNDLSNEFRNKGLNALDNRIKYHFYGHITNSRFTESNIMNQQSIADLRYPTEWFPATRTMSRTIHLHVGPTNSGKTYQALQRLEKAERGVYAGPLRLLAHEVFTRMNAKGRKCSLITGEERRVSEHGTMTEPDDLSACTVEMIPLNTTLDVAVIDEIQLIGSVERGWAWTQALLGVKAKEVHLCGEVRTVPLIQELCASTGEKLEIHRYERLSPLKVADNALDGDLKKLKKGDCIVSFSVMGIHALRRQIEKVTGRKVATVYGSLPPETRAQQARLFNDPNNDYDFLVASDAVGMGLNLAIKRMIFETSTKFDGVRRYTLGVADIKQIAGRAGRFRTATQVNEAPASQQEVAAAKGDALAKTVSAHDESNGIVTTLERFDFPVICNAMEAEPEPITSAGVHPPVSVIVRFASYFPPGTPFSFILTRLHELSKMHRRFHLCDLRDQIWLADLIEPVTGLTITDRNILVAAPAGRSDASLWRELMPAFARCVAEQKGGNIAELKELPLEVLEADVSPSREYLRDLERLHKGIVAYLWLSYRFAGIFNTRPLAFHVKSLVEQKIEEVLANFSFSEARRKQIIAKREKLLLENLMLDNDKGTAAGNDHLSEGDVDASDVIVSGTRQDGQAESDNVDVEPGVPLADGGERFIGEKDEALDDSTAFDDQKNVGSNDRVDSRDSGPGGIHEPESALWDVSEERSQQQQHHQH